MSLGGFDTHSLSRAEYPITSRNYIWVCHLPHSRLDSNIVLSHWCHLIENLQTSPLAFYQSVEQNLVRRAVPALVNTRVEYHEGSIVSAKRQYLRLTREKLAFDICAAPLGTGFFVSWRLVDSNQGSVWILWSIIAGMVGCVGILGLSGLVLLTQGFCAALGTFVTLLIATQNFRTGISKIVATSIAVMPRGSRRMM